MLRMRFSLACLFFCSLLTSIPGSASEATKLEPCKLERLEEPALCGSLEVFENRDLKTGRKIAIRVAVLKSTGSIPAPDPVFVLQGGPGQSAIKLVEFYATAFAPTRARRDIVLVDQRGTGGSNPLKCDLYDASKGPQALVADLLPPEKVRECRARLQTKADLTQYTTAVAMDDVDDVRSWLAYEKINLYGTSYGTSAALVYMQRHPEHVSGAVLKGVVAPDQRVMVTSAADSQKALDATFAACAADSECKKTYPDIAGDFMAMMKRLDAGPVKTMVKDPASGKPTEIEFSKGAAAVTLRTMLHAPASANQLLPMIHQAASGDFTALAQTSVIVRQRYPQEISFGMFLSVICAEETPFIDYEAVKKTTDGTFVGTYWVDQLMQGCEEWPRGKAPAPVRKPISTAPVLLISGGLDPVTPPWLADETAKYLPNSRHLVVPNAGHPFAGLAGCVDILIAAFLEKKSARNLDFSCAAKVQRPPF